MSRTVISSKGQVIIPKAVREAHGWAPGTELIVEERPDGVLLKPLTPFVATRIDDVSGCLQSHASKGPKSIEEMDAGLDEMFRQRASEWKA